jgi:dynein heavy chain, axonemal
MYQPCAPHAQVLEGLFIFCCMWSIGACLVQRPDAQERDRFDAFMRGIAAMGTVDSDRRASRGGVQEEG